MAKINVTLDTPIEHSGATISEVTVRTPKVREVREMERLGKDGASDVDTAVAMVLLLTDLPADAVEELDTSDLFKVSSAITGFFETGAARPAGAA